MFDSKELLSLGKKKLKPEATLGGKYVLKSFTGRGGMGEVWKAWDVVGKRFVALKFAPPDIRQFDLATKQMQETFQTIHELNHQYICPALALELDPAFGYYLAMRWLSGRSLDAVVQYNRKKQGGIPPRLIPGLLRYIAEALDYAHRRGVVHRDVKPSNIFFDIKNGVVEEAYLIDFGLATVVRESRSRFADERSETSGTRPYMPPEQWKGLKQDGRTDQYSLGVVAYELYAGRRPFVEKNFDALECAILNDPPPRVKNVPEELNATLRRVLEKNPRNRFDSCCDFIDALTAASARLERDGDEKIYAPPESAFPTSAVAERRKKSSDSASFLSQKRALVKKSKRQKNEAFARVVVFTVVVVAMAALFGCLITMIIRLLFAR